MKNTHNNYEMKKAERQRARERKQKDAHLQNTKKTFVKYGIWLVGIAVVGYALVLLAQSTGVKGEDMSRGYEIMNRQHIEVGVAHLPYNSNPPSSGWHYSSVAQGGFYTEPLADENVIHNLEHGDIWISYLPSISGEARDMLERFSGRYVVVSPRTENEGDVSLVAWGRVDTFNLEEAADAEGRIKDFIKRYDNRGPEKVRGGVPSHGGF
ncbi:MAG: DUF3105 domain-containing protein [Candidatus Paceibacterota bacterium]